jgi:CheY-like chemotaxis protein/two-component sensor histidine kinase
VSEREVRYLSGVMDNLLKISQLALGRIHPNLQQVDLTEVIARAAQRAITSSGGRGRSFTINLPADPLWAEADAGHVEEIISHLLDNAVRFTHVGNHVWVSAERQDGEVVVRVEDNGVGIPAETLPRIFDMFMQRDDSLERTQGGLGTGLTLVRRLAELQGGTIEAYSEGSGKGSIFTVHLPCAEAVAPRGAAAHAGGLAQRILVVDNNAQAAESVALLLDAWGYASRVAYDGPSALEAAAEWRPQVVLLDIGMPGMDGYEVARHLRARPELEGLILIAVTGYGEEEDRRRSREVGFDFHMVKPVPPEDLKELLAATEARTDHEATRAQP